MKQQRNKNSQNITTITYKNCHQITQAPRKRHTFIVTAFYVDWYIHYMSQ